jgi:hypothetical protein
MCPDNKIAPDVIVEPLRAGIKGLNSSRFVISKPRSIAALLANRRNRNSKKTIPSEE